MPLDAHKSLRALNSRTRLSLVYINLQLVEILTFCPCQAARPLAKRKFRKVRTWKGDRRLPNAATVGDICKKRADTSKTGQRNLVEMKFIRLPTLLKFRKMCQTRSCVLRDPNQCSILAAK